MSRRGGVTWSTNGLLNGKEKRGAFVIRHAAESIIRVRAAEIWHQFRELMILAKRHHLYTGSDNMTLTAKT